MARTKIDRFISHHIPCIDILRVFKKEKIEKHGKYIIKLDGNWQRATSDIEKGFQEYISNPNDPDKNGINKKSKANKSLNLLKTDYAFDGIVDYSLDLRHLIDYCENKRITKTYFQSIKQKNICLALVKINFEKDTKEMREFLYRQDGFTITYRIDDNEQPINYIRYKRTASGAREGSCLFIAKDLYEPMITWSSAGIDQTKAKHIDSVSWEAYIALTLSSIETTIVLDPRQILFVKDQEVIIKHEKVFEITNEKGSNALTQRPNVFSDIADKGIDKTKKQLISKNKIWDGEGLIDSSLFSENIVLKTNYSDKCMLLLRGKFFKACVFRTHIQKWFADNGISDVTHKVSDLNGYTQAKKISDIRFIIPYSCLKFLKFKDDNESNESTIKNWITDIASKNSRPLFGIIKSDKKSKLMDGQKVFTTYQMLNTLGFDEASATEFLQPTIDMMTKLSAPEKDGAHYVKYYLDHLFFSSTTDHDNYGEEIPDNSDTFKIFNYKELVASKLLEYNLDYYKTAHYNDIVKSLLAHIKKQVMNGRVLVDGVYATLFCNGIELLKYAIDKEYNPNTSSKITIEIDGIPTDIPVLEKTEIYSKRFGQNAKLLCARNPHITMGNYYLATNKICKIPKDNETIYDKYFVLSDEIVCVNAINSDIMNILNGCDFDSDTMLITNNRVMVELLKKQLRKNEKVNKFRAPFNNVDKESITPDDNITESVFLSNTDDKLSNNLIGEIVNLSQRLNSLIWMLAPLDAQREKYANWNKWTAEIGKDIYEKGCCTLAVLSNIEIDSAKRSYVCDTKNELDKIRRNIPRSEYKTLKSYTSWLNSKYTTPVIKPGDKILNLPILGLDPMGYMIKIISTQEKIIRKTISDASVNDYDFMTAVLENCNIPKSDSDCENSLKKCINALVECHDYLKLQNAKKNNHFFKRNYAKDCTQIIDCCNIINNTLCNKKVNSDALLWQLINIADNSSKLIKISSKDTTYAIVTESSKDYTDTTKENRHYCPHTLLWAALFLEIRGKKTYLTERL